MFPCDLLAKQARATPMAHAVEDGSRALTYIELLAQGSALGAGLQALTGTLRPRIAILSPNSLELVLAIAAIHLCGAVLVPLNPRNAKPEIDAQIAAARPDVMLVDDSCGDCFTHAGQTIVLTRPREGTLSLADLRAAHRGEAPRFPAVTPADACAIKFTGGSSGRPKGVVQSFRVFTTVAANMLAAWGFGSERHLVVGPLTHAAGMFLMPVLARGGCNVIAPSAKPDAVIDALERHAITLMWVPPTLLYGLLDVPGAASRRLALRHLAWGGAAAAPDKLREARRVFGPVVETSYGQTEASTIATALSAAELEDGSLIPSVGRPALLAEVRVVDPDGRSLPAGEAGEVVIRGDLVMNSYLDMPALTAETIRDGWLHTGDVGSFDDRGYLTIKDRIRDVVISGGFNVYPSDVEAALARHPAVRDVVVFGVPDARWGERVEAALELRADADATEADLIAFAKTQVGSIKAPKHIHVMVALPRSPVGKVLRREAKQLFAHAISKQGAG